MLTPTLVGDGQRLSPIDYMVWKDHVNVLDQRRIFRLLAKGPRLDGYLAQLKKAEKLDFASWGGFAQNFAGRRIPFEHPSAIPFWERAQAEESVHPDLRRFALRSVRSRHGDQGRSAHRRGVRPLDRSDHARSGRAPGVGGSGAAQSGRKSRRSRAGRSADRTACDASPPPIPRRSPTQTMKVYLLRVSTLVARGAGKYELGWKSPRGSVDSRRIDDKHADFRRNGRSRHVV